MADLMLHNSGLQLTGIRIEASRDAAVVKYHGRGLFG
jgi:hypothetical protein